MAIFGLPSTIAINHNYASIILATPDLEYYWRLKQTQGLYLNSVAATNSNMYPLIATAGVSVGTGTAPIPNGAYVTLNGTSGSLTTKFMRLSSANARTFECWIRSSTMNTGRQILWNDRGDPGYSFQIGTNIVSGGANYNLGIEIDASGTAYGAGSTGQALNDGNWHHVVGIMAGTAGTSWGNTAYYKLYVDGAVVNTYSYDTYSSGGYTVPLTPGGVGQIGQSSTAGSNWYKGDLAEFAIYARELTATEIAQHYGARYAGNG